MRRFARRSAERSGTERGLALVSSLAAVPSKRDLLLRLRRHGCAPLIDGVDYHGCAPLIDGVDYPRACLDARQAFVGRFRQRLPCGIVSNVRSQVRYTLIGIDPQDDIGHSLSFQRAVV